MREKKAMYVEMGRRLRKARLAAGLTQEQFAERTGISPQNVSCVERGLAGVSLPVLRRMCEILRVSSDSLLWQSQADNDTDGLVRRLQQLSPEQFRLVEHIIYDLLELITPDK